ncbi:MAG: D-TA family PLP-dependent enzyme, partial [Parapedobacter sp.]
MDNWYTIANEQEVDSPALLVYPDRIARNIECAIAMIGDVTRLRPHVKTHKTREILELQLKAGITKYKCATIAEAEMLGEGGAPDVLLAYPLVGPKVARFIALVKRFPHTSYAAIVDHFGAARALAETATREKVTVDAYIDLDLGMGRTGIQTGKAALDLYRR